MGDGKQTGYYWSEVYHPYKVFTDAGYQCDVVSLTGAASPDYHSVSITDQLMQFELSAISAWRDQSYPLHTLVQNPLKPDQINPANYVAVYYCGGHGAMFDFPTAAPLQRIGAQVYDNGGTVAAVCHGPAIFADMKLSNGEQIVAGKRVTAFSREEEESVKQLDFLRQHNIPLLEEVLGRNGGQYVRPSKSFSETVVDSGRLLTGANPASAGPLASAVVKILGNKAHGQTNTITQQNVQHPVVTH
jgi:putative intracellular protease/amidase